MRGRPVRRPVSADTPEAGIMRAARPANSPSNRKILLLGTLVSLVAAAPIFLRGNVPSVAAKGTLNCYDSAGNSQPCETRASAPPSQAIDRTVGYDLPASWIKTALYQQGPWPTTVVDQTADSITAPAPARRSNALGKRQATAVCGRRLIPCFFSALRRKFTHLASVAATLGQGRAAREHL